MSATDRCTTLHRQLRSALTVSVAAVALAACSDAADLTGPSYSPMPVAPRVLHAEVLATVDLESGTLTFEAARSSRALNSASGMSAAIYGNQGVTVRLYNSLVVVSPSATPGKK